MSKSRRRTFQDILNRDYVRDPPRRLDMPELDALSLPPALPGDVLHPVATYNPADPAYGWFHPSGEPITGDFRSVIATAERHARDRANWRLSRRFYRAGVPIVVSTRFLARDLSLWPTGGLPPLIWETFVWADDSSAWTWRYASRAAAFAGHGQVVTAIREAQRLRRATWRIKHARP